MWARRPGIGEVEAQQLLVAVDEGRRQPRSTLGRLPPEDVDAIGAPPLPPPNEQHLRRPESGRAVGQMRLDVCRELAGVDGIPAPRAVVLDEDPAVDAAGGGAERLAVIP